MRLALAQLRLGGTPAENLEASLAAVARAARARADLALFPEAQLTPFFAQYRRAELRRSPLRLHPDRIAVREDGPEIAALRRSARDHRLWIAPNAYLDRDDGLRADATLLVAPTGSVVGRAEMVHVANLPGFWEEDWYAPARDGFRVFDTPFGRLGVVICFDRHFPESFREVALAGADLALVPAANRFDEPFELFEAELRAAAFQNGLFVAMCNRTGADGDTFFGGRSIVVGPGGEVLLRAGPGEEMPVLDLDLGLAAAARRRCPYVALARRRRDALARGLPAAARPPEYEI